MNLLKEKLNPNSEYNKKLRRDGIAMVEEMYKEAIECLEDCIKNQPCECRNEMRLAIEALEKQIPKEPIKESMCSSNAFESWDKYYCPNCDKFLHSGARSLISKLSMSMYCCGCGQAIKWE